MVTPQQTMVTAQPLPTQLPTQIDPEMAASLKEMKDILMQAIQAGLSEKKRVYASGAAEVMNFYLGQHSYIFDPKFNASQMYLQVKTDAANNTRPARVPNFQMSDNVAAKFVQIYRPYLTQGELVRTVKPRKFYMPPPSFYGIDPQPIQMMKMQVQPGYLMQQQQAMMQMQFDQYTLQQLTEQRACQSELVESVLNYTSNELGLRSERRRIVEESLVLGGGMWMTEIFNMPGTKTKMVGSSYLSMDSIVWDPDATRIKDCKWMAVQYRMPAWMVAALFGIPESDLRPNSASTVSDKYHQSLILTAGPQNIRKQPPKDEVVFWKFWSRMGAGGRLRVKEQRTPNMDMLDGMLGDFCFFALTDCCDYPLNFGPNQLDASARIAQQNMQAMMMGLPIQDPSMPLKAAAQWPIPFWLDLDDPWPVTQLAYHHRNGSPYPIPHLEFALSYMKFMVWVISFVAEKCYRSQRDIWMIDDSIGDQLKHAIENGDDECIVKMKDLDKNAVENFVKILEAPELKKTIMDVYEFFERKFTEMTGLSDLMQAQMSRSMRSATEAQVVSDATQLRPQDMASEVMHTDTRVARKEAIACMMHMSAQDVASILGQPGAMAWNTLVSQADPVKLLRETEFEVIASPGRTLDLSTRSDQANKMAQLILPVLTNLGMQTGLFGPANQVLVEWAKANQIDPDLVQFPNMPPPPPEAPPKGQASSPKPSEPQQGPK